MVVTIVLKDMVGVGVDSNFPIDFDVHIVFHIYGNTFSFVGHENITPFAGEPKLT